MDTMTTTSETKSVTRFQVDGKSLLPHPELGICLDVGCGSGPRRPSQNFSAYCDVIQPRAGVDLPEPYWHTPMECLRVFDDDTFDWVRSHHSIEHCSDPDKACAELQRVGKAGIISYPPAYACQMFGRADHNWLVYEDRGRLLFVEKWHESLGVPRAITGCALNCNFEWSGSFEWQVVRTGDIDVKRRRAI